MWSSWEEENGCGDDTLMCKIPFRAKGAATDGEGSNWSKCERPRGVGAMIENVPRCFWSCISGRIDEVREWGGDLYLNTYSKT